jgi:hypothetical protein
VLSGGGGLVRGTSAAAPPATRDVAAARSVFDANLDAIRRRDRNAYLACYLRSPGLARTGPTGFSLGYAALDSSAGTGWPDHFDALDLMECPHSSDHRS